MYVGNTTYSFSIFLSKNRTSHGNGPQTFDPILKHLRTHARTNSSSMYAHSPLPALARMYAQARKSARDHMFKQLRWYSHRHKSRRANKELKHFGKLILQRSKEIRNKSGSSMALKYLISVKNLQFLKFLKIDDATCSKFLNAFRLSRCDNN